MLSGNMQLPLHITVVPFFLAKAVIKTTAFILYHFLD